MIRTLCLVLGMTLALGAISATPATAQKKKSLEEQKTEWQTRYRTLLSNEARFEYNIEAANENYARAQRRNYPRGGARQQFLVDADKAEKDLAKVKTEIEALKVEARQKAIPPNWLFAVEDENIGYSPPASNGSDADAAEDDGGRNPLYLEDDDEKKKK